MCQQKPPDLIVLPSGTPGGMSYPQLALARVVTDQKKHANGRPIGLNAGKAWMAWPLQALENHKAQ